MGATQGWRVLQNDTTHYVILIEPPAKRADPHVRWCERGRLITAPYSIYRERSDLRIRSSPCLRISREVPKFKRTCPLPTSPKIAPSLRATLALFKKKSYGDFFKSSCVKSSHAR